MEGYQLEGKRGSIEEKVQGSRSIIGKYKIDRGRLRIVWDSGKRELQELL